MKVATMPRTRTTVIKHEKRPKPIRTVFALLVSAVCAFGILTLFLAHDHTRADELLSAIPSPFGASSLAADPGLAAQVRTRNAHARLTRLSDQSTALVVETEVVNESSVPISRVAVEATLLSGDHQPIIARSECGKVVSDTLLNRLPPEEVATLMEIPVPAEATLAPGAAMDCQMALPGVDSSAHEVELKVVSAEPLPGHSRFRLRPWE